MRDDEPKIDCSNEPKDTSVDVDGSTAPRRKTWFGQVSLPTVTVVVDDETSVVFGSFA
jgi:hypothetical protein